jgi:hypothetical protein
MIHF